MIPSRAPPARQRCMEAPSRYCGCTTQPVPKLFPTLHTTAPPRRSFAKIRPATQIPQGHDYARTTNFCRDLPLSFFTALRTSLPAFNAFLFRQYDLPPQYDIHTVPVSLSRQYASIRHDILQWIGKNSYFLLHLFLSRSVSWECRYEVMISFSVRHCDELAAAMPLYLAFRA